MKQKKIPMRTCTVTHEKYPKKELIRVVRTPEGQVLVDETGKQNGRGAYLKKDKEVIEKARTTKVLERHLETSIEDKIYDELLEKCN
jgi:predicted RNA-binding protein YlxR (DUF448 family)